MNEEQWWLLRKQHWLLLKQQFPLGRKFWGKVGQIRPFGIFVEVDDFPKNTCKYIGLIHIGPIFQYKEVCKPLPLDYDQWPQEGMYIYCIVSYHQESQDNNNGQLCLRWLGKANQSKQWLLLRKQHWLLLKQRYPIGYKFWARVRQFRSSNILVEVDDFPRDSYKYTGSIYKYNIFDIAECQELPPDCAQWFKEGTYIYCMVCYYSEKHNNDNGQMGLGWLGEISQSRPEK